MKPTFGNAKMPGSSVKLEPRRKEKVVIWRKTTDNGDSYLSIKINDVNGETLHLTAYEKKDKKSPAMPDFVAYEKE